MEVWLIQEVMAMYSGARTMVGHEDVRCGAVADTSGECIAWWSEHIHCENMCWWQQKLK